MAFIGQLALQVRRGRWTRQALASEVEAGPEAFGAARAGAGTLGALPSFAPAGDPPADPRPRPRPPAAPVPDGPGSIGTEPAE